MTAITPRQTAFVFVLQEGSDPAATAEAVRAALGEWQRSSGEASAPQTEAAVDDWLSLNCLEEDGASESSTLLFEDFLAATRLEVTHRSFGLMISARGFGQRKRGGHIWRTGLRLLRPHEIFAHRRSLEVEARASTERGGFGEAGSFSRRPLQQSFAASER